MELKPLFEMQGKLDKGIEKKKPVKFNEDRFSKKMLALFTELGELANEERSWKFWSEDQEPRTEKEERDFFSDQVTRTYNPLLEEFVDVFHFILSIGNDVGVNVEALEDLRHPKKMEDTVQQFMWVNFNLNKLFEMYRNNKKGDMKFHFLHLFNAFLGLGLALGFDEDEIEQAYYKKNEINWKRQAEGY